MGHQRRVICNNHKLKRPVAAAELVFVEMLCAQWAGPVLFFIGFGIHLSALFPLVTLHGRLGTLEDPAGVVLESDLAGLIACDAAAIAAVQVRTSLLVHH